VTVNGLTHLGWFFQHGDVDSGCMFQVWNLELASCEQQEIEGEIKGEAGQPVWLTEVHLAWLK
jgi:hypothetical protein